MTPGWRPATDQELVLRFQEGDAAAYDEIYDRYRLRVMRVCQRMLLSQSEAEEAAQETFLKAYQALARFNGSYQVGAWLSRIAANVCLDNLRARARSGRSVMLVPEELPEHDLGPEELLAGGDERLQDILASIQPLHAQALRLRAVEGLSHNEMAGRLEMSAPQVKALLHRARTSFRRAWKKAEGWAMAPLLALDSLFGQRSKAAPNASTNLVSATSGFGPFMADKIVASAVIVAVALGGIPSGSLPSTTQDGRIESELDVAKGALAREHRKALADEDGSKATTARAGKSILKPLEELVETASGTLQQQGGGADPPDEYEGEEKNPLRPHMRTLPKEVRKVIRKVLDPL